MPNGALEVGGPAAPVPSHLTAEIVIKNRPLDTGIDPKQFGTGIVSVNGWIIMHGAPKHPTFVRLTSAPRAGDSTLIAAQVVSGWQAGDREPLRR